MEKKAKAETPVNEAVLLNRLASALLVACGERADDAYLLWYLGDASGSLERFELGWREGRQMCALPLWLLDCEHPPEARFGAACAALDLIEGSALHNFARVVFVELWLRQGERDLANRFAVEALTLDPGCRVMPLPGCTYELSQELLTTLWRGVVEAEQWEAALRLMAASVVMGMSEVLITESSSLLGRFQAFWPLLLWCGDHAPLSSLDSERIRRFAACLADASEARAFQVLSFEVAERTMPLVAARGFRELAESGADELFAVARLRAQRAFVRAGEWGEASEVARSRAELCSDERLAHGLLVVTGLYAAVAEPERACDALRLVLKASVERHFAGASAMASPALELCEGLLEAQGGHVALRRLYNELEDWLPEDPSSSEIFRRYERILMLGDGIMLMSVVQLLEHVVVSWPELLPMAFDLAVGRLSDEELTVRLGQLPRDSAEASMVRPLLSYLKARAGDFELLRESFSGAAYAPMSAFLQVWGGGDEVAFRGALASLTEHETVNVRCAARVVLAWRALERAERDVAREHLVCAAALGFEDPMVRVVVERLAVLSPEPGLLEALYAEAEERRFRELLQHHAEASEWFERAHERSKRGDWRVGGEQLFEAARGVADPWIQARLYERAAEWLGDRAALVERAAVASRLAYQAEPGPGRAQSLVLRLADAGAFEALRDALDEFPDVQMPAEALVEACVERWRALGQKRSLGHVLVGVIESLFHREDVVQRPALRLCILERLYDVLVEDGRLADARRLLIKVEHGEHEPALLATSSLLLGRMEAEHFDDETAAIKHLRAALMCSETRPRSLRTLMDLHERMGRWGGLVEFLLGAAQDLGEPAVAADCLLCAADVLFEQHEGERARALVERVIGLQPERFDAHERLLRFLEDRGDVEGSMRVLEQLIELSSEGRNPEQARFRATLARHYREQGQVGHALTLQLNAFIAHPVSWESFERLARLLLERPESYIRLHRTAIRAIRERRLEGELEPLFARMAAVQLVALDRPREAAQSLTEALRLSLGGSSYFEDIVQIAERLDEPLIEAHALAARLEALPHGDKGRPMLLERAALLYEERLSMPGRAAEMRRELERLSEKG